METHAEHKKIKKPERKKDWEERQRRGGSRWKLNQHVDGLKQTRGELHAVKNREQTRQL